MLLRSFTLIGLVLMIAGCVADPKPPKTDPVSDTKMDPDLELNDGESPAGDADVFLVKFETSKGDFIMEVHPQWAPIGAAHFKELVENKFYDDARFFRVIDGFMAQFGISGDPAMNSKWGDNIKDDRRTQPNQRGMVSYAMTGAPNSRSTQLFINFTDNSGSLDPQNFAPFARVVVGMSVVDQLHREEVQDQGRIEAEGNRYLIKSFPQLDYIKTARIVDSAASPAEAAPISEAPAADAAPPASAEASPAAE